MNLPNVVQELRRYMRVDQYGKCNDNPCDMNTCLTTLSQKYRSTSYHNINIIEPPSMITKDFYVGMKAYPEKVFYYLFSNRTRKLLLRCEEKSNENILGRNILYC